MESLWVFIGFLGIVNGLDLYPHGETSNDTIITSGTKTLTLTQPLTLFADSYNEIIISLNGLIWVNSTENINFHGFPSNHRIISVYFRHAFEFGILYYRETYDDQLLQRASHDVRKKTNDNFTATQALVLTYNVKNTYFVPHYNIFQAVLVTNGYKTYVVFSYKELVDNDATVGFGDYDCNVQLLASKQFSTQIAYTSNINETGRHIYELGQSTVCNFSIMYNHTEPSEVKKGNDISERFNLTKPIPIFKNMEDTVYVNVNGVLTFSSEYPEVTWRHAGTMILPYHIDLTTEENGRILFEEKFDQETLERASNDVRVFDHLETDFEANHVVIVTYENVPKVGFKYSKHTFQIVMASDGRRTFLILHYMQLDFDPLYWGAYINTIYNCFNTYMEPSQSMRFMNYFTNSGIEGKQILSLTPIKCYDELLYGFGKDWKNLNFGVAELKLNVSMPFPEAYVKTLFIADDGFVSGEVSPASTSSSTFDPTSQYDFPVLAGYSASFADPFYNLFSTINYAEVTKRNILEHVSSDIRLFTMDSFNATQVVLATYEGARTSVFLGMNTFQIVLASDDSSTYAVLNYVRLNTPRGIVGYSSSSCNWTSYVKPEDSRMLVKTSNIGIPGRHVIPLVDRCYKSAMYPYGPSEGDRIIAGDSLVDLEEEIPLFFGTTRKLYIQTKGFVSVKSTASNLYIPHPGDTFIAVYGSDYSSGDIYIRESTDTAILVQASMDIKKYTMNTDFHATRVVVITYMDMFSKRNPLEKNTFQLVIATNTTSTYGVFNYLRLDTDNGITGYNMHGCDFQLNVDMHHSRDLTRKKMHPDHVIGRAVQLLLPSRMCGPTTMYPFGEENGDTFMTTYYSRTLTLRHPVPWLSKPFERIYIVGKGSISINTRTTSTYYYTLKRYNVIAAYLEELDTRYGGAIYYQVIYGSTSLTDSIVYDVKRNFTDLTDFYPNTTLLVSYVRVAHSRLMPSEDLRSTFQVAVISDGTDTYAVMNFLKLEGNGLTGFSDISCDDGDNKRYTIKEWGKQNLLNSTNTGNMGQHVFKLTDHNVCSPVPATTTTTSTTTTSTTTTATTTTTTTTAKSTTTSAATSSPETTAASTTSKATTSNVYTVRRNDKTSSSAMNTTAPAKSEESTDLPLIAGGATGGILIILVIVVATIIIKKRYNDGGSMKKMEKNGDVNDDVYENKGYENHEMKGNGP